MRVKVSPADGAPGRLPQGDTETQRRGDTETWRHGRQGAPLLLPRPHSGSGLIRWWQPGQGLGKVPGSQGTMEEAVGLKAICGEWAKVFPIILV